MQVRFDSFDRFEQPKFYVCSPGCEYKKGVLTKVLGCLSDTSDEEFVVNFNTTSELNFRVNKVRRRDPDENEYAQMLYRALQNRRLIFVEDVGFFVIKNVTVGYDAGVNYKDIQALSCECELGDRVLPYIKDGTYKFTDLLEKIIASLPLWKIGDVNGDVADKYRTFEDVSEDKNALSFLLEDMQDAYECIFVFDDVNRIVSVYDQNAYVRDTQIHLTKNDLINSVEIKENSDDLYTAISVQGDDNLNVSPVNPIGTNVVYNFNYYLEWMTPFLRDKVMSWQNLVSSKEDEYYLLNLEYYSWLTDQTNYNSEIDKLNIQLSMYQRCRDNIVASGSTTTVESYNEIIEKNGGVPVGIQNELAATLAEIDRLIVEANQKVSDTNSAIEELKTAQAETQSKITEIHDKVSILSYFTDEEYAELCNYIFEGNYTDEYITVTTSMTYSERFQQMKTLYDRAKKRLERISAPTQEFDLDIENFLFSKRFEKWSQELETGVLINVELDENDIAPLFLSNITVNYSDKSLSMTFGNRFNRFDQKAIFSNVLGDVKKSANSISYIKEILYPVKDGEFDAMKAAIESSGILTKNAVLTSENQEIIIDDTGILGRMMLEDGTYDDKQIKITNQTIVFTDDGWETARTAIGNFLFNNPLSGEVESHYGVIADTLIGSMVLSEEVGIYNTDNSITLDKNGFTLTSDYTGDVPKKNVFTIQKKLLDEDGNEYYEKQLYIDDDGNVILNGTLSVFTELQAQLQNKTDALSETITNNTNDLYEAIRNESDELNTTIDTKIDGVNASVSNQINTISSEIDNKYATIIGDVNSQLEAHKADVGQYMTFNDDGLTLGATTSEFKTIIDNTGLYFKQGNTIVSYVDNNQLHIPNAVIESTLILGNFFFSPRNDGGVSLTWQE